MQRLSIVITALTTLVGPSLAQNANPKRPGTTVIVYDDFHKPGGYTLADYDAKWSILTLGEMAVEDTRQFDNHSLSISATPFRTGKDSSVADHGKYIALSKRVFVVPEITSPLRHPAPYRATWCTAPTCSRVRRTRRRCSRASRLPPRSM